MREVMEAVHGCFARSETREGFRQLVEGILAIEQSANCWSLAEHLGHAGPHRLQHLLSRARFDHEVALRAVGSWAVRQLDDGQGVLVVDETGDAKSSTDAVGAAHQYSGSIGGTALCQVAVHLTYATRHGHCLIDRRLYLGAGWAADEERRLLTGVPEEVGFATKPQQATTMIEDFLARGHRAAWAAGDEVYGSIALRTRLRTLGLGYVMAVRSNHHVDTAWGRLDMRALRKKLPATAWQRIATGQGSKGIREYDWAMIEVLADDQEDPDASTSGTPVNALLLRRHRYTREVSAYRCYNPAPASLATFVKIACWRWRVEEDFQEAKRDCALDQGQVTCWNSWHRWSLAALTAYTLLAVAAHRQRAAGPPPETKGDAEADDIEMVPLSCTELLRILRAFVLPAQDRRPEHLVHWIIWRRTHQHHATRAHRHWHEITAEDITAAA